VLEVGCGQGVAVDLIMRRFVDAHIVAIDLDARMVKRARRRLNGHHACVEVRVGDLCALPFDDGSFDVIVDFAAVHHVPDWQVALGEIARLLAPGGQFLFEDHDVNRHNWLARRLFAHPAERFTASEFAGVLAEVGIDVDDALDDRDGHFLGRGIKRAS
jgi:ubiquinone/menaquinone biosynthesis C-methylase UbiE